MKIALFTYSTKPRGGVIHTIELAEALQQLGHQVCIYALDKDNVGFHRSLKCPYRLVPTKQKPETIEKLIAQRIQEFIDYLIKDRTSYDIYHSQDCISTNALKVLRDRKLIPHFIRTVHHIDEFNSPYLQECHDRSILEPDLCFCVSKYWQEQLQQQYKINAPVIINGVNIEKFDRSLKNLENKLKQKLGIKGNPIYLTIGGIEPRKNSLKLLAAFDRVLKFYPQAQLIIAGGDTLFDYQPYRIKFFKLVEKYNLTIGESIVLPGVIADEDLPILYHCADAFVFPSIKEGWGLVLLEAIASGIPVITSNIAPFTEFLAQNSAILVNPNSVEKIAEGMIKILDGDVRENLIKNSQLIPYQYSWEKSAQIHINIYQQLIES